MIYITTQSFPPDIGGIQTYVYQVARELAAQGNAVTVYVDQVKQPNTLEFDRQQIFPIVRFGGMKLLRRLRKARALSQAVASTGGIILCDSWKSLELISDAVRQSAKIICLAHGMEFPADGSDKKKSRIARILSKAHVVLANSHFTYDRIKPYVPASVQVDVFLPGMAVPPALDETTLQVVRERCKPFSPSILTIGRLEPRKGQDKLIGAVARLQADFPDIHYFILGVGEDTARLKELVRKKGLADRVTFLGSVSEQEKFAWLASIDIFAMPSRAEGNSVEGFGIVYLEAAYFGKPSLAGRVGGAGDAVLDQETGILCDGSSEESVTQGLRVLADKSRRETLGTNAKVRVERDFMWPNAIERLKAFF